MTWYLAAGIVFLAVFGGVEFYLNPRALACFIALYLGLLGWALVKRPAPPAVMTIFRWPVAALIVAALVNFRPDWWMVSRLWLVSAALLVVLLVRIDPDCLRQSLHLAAFPWALMYLFWPDDNRNIQAGWPVLFIIAALAGKVYPTLWLFFAGQTAFLFYFGSRGAMVGLAAAVVVYYFGQVKRTVLVSGSFVAGALAMAGVLLVWRPGSALNRLFYWRRGLEEFLRQPLFGQGPGSIRSLGLIFEGGTWHGHAHNFIISTLAETGLIGLAGLGMAARRVYELLPALKIERWQVAALVGLAAHSLVDEPLWWPGPLLMAALIVSSIQETNGQPNFSHSTASG